MRFIYCLFAISMSTNSTSRHHRGCCQQNCSHAAHKSFHSSFSSYLNLIWFYFLLNLTAVDIVIHFNPWWNIAAQNQATDRAHRIGQENTVTVYKLIAEHTIEEQIQKLQKNKQDLAEEILSGKSISNILIDRDEILKLL